MVNLLSTTDKLFEKVILKIVRALIEERGLLNASQFGFRARHSTTLHCMRLRDDATLDFNNKCLGLRYSRIIKRTADKTLHLGFLYILS
jgi:hypothetical protein